MTSARKKLNEDIKKYFGSGTPVYTRHQDIADFILADHRGIKEEDGWSGDSPNIDTLQGIKNNLYNRSKHSNYFGCRIIPEEDFDSIAEAIGRFVEGQKSREVK